MQSNNPIFRRSGEFQRSGASGRAAGTGYVGSPSTWSTGAAGASAGTADGGYAPTTRDSGPMTIDSVVQKTAIALGVVIVTALATWMLIPDLNVDGAMATAYSAAMIGGIGAFALSLVNSFKREISPALVLAFCAVEGVALGGFSKVIDAYVSASTGENSVVSSAVLGTFAAFAGTLAAYKFFDIKVGDKFRKGVMAGVFGMVGLSVLSLVLSMFGVNTGLFGFGILGTLMSLAGLALGIFMLILDFDFVEQGIANQIPEKESWRAAFAMTVSLVWIYTNLLRLLAIFQSD